MAEQQSVEIQAQRNRCAKCHGIDAPQHRRMPFEMRRRHMQHTGYDQVEYAQRNAEKQLEKEGQACKKRCHPKSRPRQGPFHAVSMVSLQPQTQSLFIRQN